MFKKMVVLMVVCLFAIMGSAVAAPLKVGLMFDVGGKGDGSFNDSSYRGIEWAAKDFGIEHLEVEPGPDADREAGIRMLASQGFDMIIAVGFLNADPVKAVAKDFPKIKFAVIDGVVEGMPNVASLVFKEQDGSFLVGIIAGMKAKADGKNTVGFVGGMDIPLIHRFEAGYKAGIAYVYPECKVLSDYAGTTGQAFIDPVKGKELALAQIDKGAYIIYHASGLTGAGVFEAGKERKVFVIGVDSNQNSMGHVEATKEDFGLTSMLKQVDVSVYLTIKDIVEGKFQAGIRTFGLGDVVKIGDATYRGVYYAVDEYNQKYITKEIVEKIAEAEKKIIAGEIKVPME